MSTSIKLATLEEVKPHRLTQVKGRKPTFYDIKVWEEECSTIATKVKTHTIQGGRQLGFLAKDFEYDEPTKPEEYSPDITREEEDHKRARLEAEHKCHQGDYKRYLAL
jgi:hypothetical protein